MADDRDTHLVAGSNQRPYCAERQIACPAATGLQKWRIAPKAMARSKERVREGTSRTRGVSTERMAGELARHLRGWIGYFGTCETPSVLQSLEEVDQISAWVSDLEAVEAEPGAIRSGFRV